MKGRPGIRLSLSPGRRCRGAQWCRLACHGMDCNPLDTTAIQSIPMDWYGLHRVGIQPIHCQRRACGRGRASERARTLREACVREPGIGGGACGSPETAKTDLSSRLRTRVRRAINTVIAQLLPAAIAPEIPPLETRAMTAASDPQIVPARGGGGATRQPTRASPRAWRPSSPTTPAASTPPSGGSSPTGAATWTCALCRPGPSPPRVIWPSAPAPTPPSPPWA